MKRIKATFLLLSLCSVISAQENIRVWINDNSTRLPIGEMTYSNSGKTVTIGDETFNTSDVDSITIVKTIYINYDGNNALVDLGHAKGVTYEANGAHVTINNTNTSEEMEFVLAGTSTNGSLTYNGSYKCKFILNGLTLTSKTGAAIDIESGKRSDLILMEGTTNTLEDAALGTQKACLYCDGHLEISGGGSLIVAGNSKHAIATNEYMQLKKTTGTITITKAASDAIHAEQYFQMNGGVLNISGMVGDGIQAEAKVNKVVENNGEVIIKGGSITIAVTSNDTKGIKSDTDIHISGGTFNIAASGAGSKGISCNGNMFINEDDNTTTMTITASGRIYTDADDNDSRCMGIKVDGNLTISAGTITVYNTGSGSRGIKIDGTYTKSGTAKVNASVKN